jgi:hypothetical protein
VTPVYNPSYVGGIKRRTEGKQTQGKHKTLPEKITKTKKRAGDGSSGRAPA